VHACWQGLWVSSEDEISQLGVLGPELRRAAQAEHHRQGLTHESSRIDLVELDPRQVNVLLERAKVVW
jgi:hypothetical protein